ncbi:PDxFFG protein [Mycoplasma mycoides]|uniref:PDxFFG protein n=1 Tax=Mycoplasma mycoides TaxID=2102 RepID=UPI0022401A4C|nr:PDxFFG protein [Mycoplasma mycoides]QVK02728.1 PDxFFG protein [Mycoplasma mycoides subsp. capri]QVK03543.1 PDxFFG protein [Mycoplasma mycoides subsp. capri]
MPKINFKKYVWHKYAISASLIIAATTAILGSAYKYSNTSVEKLGRKNFSDEESFKNAFIDPNALPVTQFSEIHNNKFKVDYDPLKDVVKVNGKELSVDKYLDQYYKKYHALPYLNIRYGSFNFYNQYIEAVSPQEFFKFTKWFMKNVSWGPEIITLKSFSIVKGVEMNSNSITLGAHSNKNKEETTIKFYPDAFFGTLPIYSSLSGRGNAHESLTYKLNQQVLTKKDLESFLTNISNYNSLANLSQQTIDKSYFRGITNVSFLKGQKVFVYKQKDWYNNFSNSFSELEKKRLEDKSDYLFVIPASNLNEAKNKLEIKLSEYKKNDKYNLFKNIDPKNVALEEKTIESAEVKQDQVQPNGNNKVIDKKLLITFNDKTKYFIHNAFGDVLTEQTNNEKKTTFVALKDYVQFSKAVEEFKSKLKNIETQIKELKKSKTDKNTQFEKLEKEVKTISDKSNKLNNNSDSKNGLEQSKTLKEVSKSLFDLEAQILQTLNQSTKNRQFKEQNYYNVDFAYTLPELISIESLVENRNKLKLNWRDFYNIDEFISDRENINKGITDFFVYSKYAFNSNKSSEKISYQQLLDENDLIVAKTKIELVDILTKRKLLKPNANQSEINKLVFKADITNVKKENKNLLITIKEVLKSKTSNKQKEFGNKVVNLSINSDTNHGVIRAVNDFFSVLGYKKMVSPSVLKEESDLRNPITGEIEKTFDVYTDAYEDLIDELLEKVPYAAQWLEGPHIKKVIDENGVMQYKLENGKYLGFTKDDRIGLWAILKMSDKNFKGISTDFLKFVGAHEYGHHITLNGAHDLGNKGSDPIFISALTPGATPNINNYYSREAVDLFLKARTHIELETKRLLDQFGVIKDYGEYATFNFAKKDKNGSISFDNKSNKKGLEDDSDIWGVNIEDPNIRTAFSNKKRRFLQDFAGLLEAARERQKQNGLEDEKDKKWLSPFDLWIANAIDFYSGTLNPTVNSSNKENEVVKYMYKDEKGELKFRPASLKMLDGILKDGKGNPIQFKTTKNGKNETVEPIIVKGEQDAEGKYTKITEVLVYDKDGSPIVNVPLNVDLKTDGSDPAKTIEFVNEKIKVVEKTIKSLVVDKYSINGWNKADTRLSLDSKIDLNYPAIKDIFGTRIPPTVNEMFKKIYGNYVSNRNVETGSYKNDGKNNIIKYYNLDASESNVNHKYKDKQSSLIYANPKNLKGNNQNGQNNFATLLGTLFTAGGSEDNTTNGGSGQVLWISKDKMYMPNVKLQDAYTSLYFLSRLPKEYEQIFNAKKVLKWMSEYTPTFIASKFNKNGIWSMVNKSEQLVMLDNGSGQTILDVNKLKLNYSNGLKELDHNILNGLFGSLTNLDNGTLEFTETQKWLDFVNVDFTKAKYNPSDDAVNWNIEYVKSKVNIDKFKTNFKTHVLGKLDSIASMNANQKEAFKRFYAKANNDKSDQMWANEIMRRFSSSYFAMFNSALSIDDIKTNKDLGWIFDSVHGYGDFKKSEFKIKNPDKDRWEISTEDMLSAYDKFAKELNVETKQLNLVDALVFDNKIQLYTDQTKIHIANKKFDLLSIFSSLANAQFHTSPSQDVLEYFHNKTERKFNELFSDYTYSFAEVINRDNLQITYSPSNHDFGNMPSFLSNISEATTGLEYVVDGTTTAKWKKRAIKINDRDGRNGIVNTILDYEKLVDNEAKNKAEALNLKYRNSKLSQKSNLSDDSNYNNSYFGEFQSINNGWFKDRWYRDFLDFKLYDDNGKPIEDKTIRIKDLENKVVTSRVNAYWQYYIQSQGVGKRNISGIWRDATKDAVAMFGYLSSDVANKANYLAFKNQETGEVKTVKINKQFSSNMFYYKTQNIENEAKYEAAKTDTERNAIRHTLAHEKYDYKDTNGHHKGTGFVSWVSDYAIMSKYQNALLKPGQKYSVYFSSDKKGTKDIIKTDLGDFQSIAENGKTFSQAPIRMEKSKKPVKVDANGFKHYENTLYVYDQFNGVK